MEIAAKSTVIKDWDNMRNCAFAKKCWVDKENINEYNEDYKKGFFVRVWCIHDSQWCNNTSGNPNYCAIFIDHKNE